jgi:hypothetical protein
MKKPDIDIDLADRTQVLNLITHIAARQEQDDKPRRHNSGVYVTPIPYDPIHDCAAFDFREAEERGYFKLDLLNMSVYQLIRDQDHYDQLLATEPPWARLQEPEFVAQIVHINNHYDLIQRMPEPVDTVPRMAMFLSLIRPGKRHLVGRSWYDISEQIWSTSADGYTFKKSHAISYALLVALHMNLVNSAH